MLKCKCLYCLFQVGAILQTQPQQCIAQYVTFQNGPNFSGHLWDNLLLSCPLPLLEQIKQGLGTVSYLSAYLIVLLN